MQCVLVDPVTGNIVKDIVSVAPNCAEFALLLPHEVHNLTYFAQLAQVLDPSEPDVYLLMAACTGLFATAFVIRQIARLILNR